MFIELRKWGTYFISIVLLGLMVGQPSSTIPVRPTTSGASSQEAIAKAALANLPLRFEANLGQTDPSVRFLAQGAGYTLFLTDGEAVMAISAPAARRDVAGRQVAPTPLAATVLHYKFQGADPSPKVVGLNELPGKSNYFIGSDPAKWYTNVPNYARIEYQNIYPGINLAYYGKSGVAEYDFIVQPGANPGAIKIAVTGADKVSLEASDLVLHTVLGDLHQPAPHIYQDGPNGPQEIAGNYQLFADGAVGFQVAAYDPTKPLTIDPTLNFSTYLGGSSTDTGTAIAVSSASSNNPDLYITGQTASINFTTTVGAYWRTLRGPTDAFVLKLVNSGGLYSYGYSTYLGGPADPLNSLSGDDSGNGIAVDGSGNAYVTGYTQSDGFPTTTGAFQTTFGGASGLRTTGDAFVTKLNANGSGLIYSTYLGGNDDDSAAAIAIDSSGYAYVTGQTYSSNFPLTPSGIQGSCPACHVGLSDAFVTKLGTGGTSLIYSTYLGGSGNVNTGACDYGTGIVVDGSGHAFITGSTASSDFPTTSGAYQRGYGGGMFDAFVTEIPANPIHSWAYSTYLGGGGWDNANAIALDSSGQATVTGSTSGSFPLLHPIQSTYGGGSDDAFIAKLKSLGSGLVYSTYLGGGADDIGRGIAIDSSDNTFVTGQTSYNTTSTPFPTVNAFQSGYGGGSYDAFVTKVNSAGSSLLYSSFLGGSGAEGGLGIAWGSCTNCANKVAYVTGYTFSSDFPTLNPTQSSNGGGQDAFITRIDP